MLVASIGQGFSPRVVIATTYVDLVVNAYIKELKIYADAKPHLPTIIDIAHCSLNICETWYNTSYTLVSILVKPHSFHLRMNITAKRHVRHKSNPSRWTVC